MKYRDFLDLTDEEIEFILKDIFKPTKIQNVSRNAEWNQITVGVTTQWGSEDDEDGIVDMEDEITLTLDNICAPFGILKDDLIKWKQFLFAKGCHWLLKDNPYLNIGVDTCQENDKSKIVNKVEDESYIQWIEEFVKEVLALSDIFYEETTIVNIEPSKRVFLSVDGQKYTIRTWSFRPFSTDDDGRINAETVLYTLYKVMENDEGSFGEEISTGNGLIEWKNK